MRAAEEHGAGLLTGMNAAGPKAEKAHRAIGNALTTSIAEGLIATTFLVNLFLVLVEIFVNSSVDGAQPLHLP